MNSSLNAFSRVVTKHVLGSQEHFNELKERLAMCEHATSKAGAAALGYLMAMEEKGNASNVYDLVVEQVENERGDAYARTDQIFLAIYRWLDEALKDDGYEKENYVRQFIANKFDRYIP